MFIHRFSSALSSPHATKPHPHPPHGVEIASRLNPQDVQSDLLKFGRHATGLEANDLINWLIRFRWADRFHLSSDKHPERLRFRKSNDVIAPPHSHSGDDGVHRQFIDHVAKLLHTHARTLARAVGDRTSLGRARNRIQRESGIKFRPSGRAQTRQHVLSA
jgi:hypothetical protein